MKIVIARLFWLLAILSFTPMALAHTGLSSSVPENNQQMQKAPEQLQLTYSGPVRLARVELRGPDGVRQDLDISEQREVSTSFALALPDNLVLGKHTARWTILGEDGHTMAGVVSFTIQGP